MKYLENKNGNNNALERVQFEKNMTLNEKVNTPVSQRTVVIEAYAIDKPVYQRLGSDLDNLFPEDGFNMKARKKSLTANSKLQLGTNTESF